MKNNVHTVYDRSGQPVTVRISRDRRLKKSARWTLKDGEIHLRIPYNLPQRELKPLLEDVGKSLNRARRRTKNTRTDADLQARAAYINHTCFNDELEWHAICWVSNMRARLGSCTNGGSTDGHIRISDRIRDWPEWVVDYVIAHELAHRRYPDHSADFWEYLVNAYPLAERARGFIMGVGFVQKEVLEDD